MRLIVRLYLALFSVLALALVWLIVRLQSVPSIHRPDNVFAAPKGDIKSAYLNKRIPIPIPAKAGFPTLHPHTCPPCPQSSVRTPCAPQSNVPDKAVDVSLVTQELESLMSDLTKIHSNTRSSSIKYQLHNPINKVRKLLQGFPSTRNITTDIHRIPKILPTSKDVCPEKYNSSDLSAGYPFFYKGFNMMNCTNVPPFSAVISVVFNVVQKNLGKDIQLSTVIRNIHAVHPNTNILIGVTHVQAKTLHKHGIISPTVRLMEFKKRKSTSDIWNSLIRNVTTQYVLVARDVTHFTWHSRLERLVREVTQLNASVVAGAYRDLTNGVWSAGCEQLTIQNYTLSYQAGYDWSTQECMVCDTVKGPFAARTTFLQKNPLPKAMSDVSGFETWFIQIKKDIHLTVSCPDAMFFTSRLGENNKLQWLNLSRFIQVERIKLSQGKELTFTCEEADVGCSLSKGFALSHCCMRELSRMVKTFLKLCKKSGSLCELQEGTLLGAVKFNGVLPWERDADVTFHSSNFSAISRLKKDLSQLGYSLSVNKDPWCCVDNVIAGGIFMLTSNSWHVEIYGQHLMDSEKLIKEGITPTLIEFDGQLVATPASPGLFARNRYGHEIFQHVQHWQTISASSGWAFYEPSTFSQCQAPGHHSCLDQYLADGNIQFKLPT